MGAGAALQTAADCVCSDRGCALSLCNAVFRACSASTWETLVPFLARKYSLKPLESLSSLVRQRTRRGSHHGERRAPRCMAWWPRVAAGGRGAALGHQHRHWSLWRGPAGCQAPWCSAALNHRAVAPPALLTLAGERPEDQEGLLQGQGVPEAHDAQGHPVQDGQGVAVCPGCARAAASGGGAAIAATSSS